MCRRFIPSDLIRPGFNSVTGLVKQLHVLPRIRPTLAAWNNVVPFDVVIRVERAVAHGAIPLLSTEKFYLDRRYKRVTNSSLRPVDRISIEW